MQLRLICSLMIFEGSYRANEDFGRKFSLYMTLEYMRGIHLRSGAAEGGKDPGRIVDSLIYHSDDLIDLDVQIADVSSSVVRKALGQRGNQLRRLVTHSDSSA